MSDPEQPPDLDGETRERGTANTDRPTVTLRRHHVAIGRRVGGRYEILEELGSEGFRRPPFGGTGRRHARFS